GFGWPFADVGVARAAAAAGIPYTLSTMATASIERIAREAGGRLWFQAYIFRERGMTLGLVERARQLGYEALMITVDVPVGGKRERDFRNDFAIRFRFTPRNVLDFASHPGWVLSVLRHGMPVLENVADLGREAKSTAALPPIGRAVRGRMSVLVDGGVRRGVDVVKALALGAEGVMLGRATLYGACAAGEAGAARALHILGDELVRAMQLSGVRSVGEI